MAGYPGSAKYRKLLATFGTVQRRQFWTATGIDVSKRAVNEERFAAFKKSLADYREAVAESGDQVRRESVESGPDCVCDSCGTTNKNEIYVVIPQCVRFCRQCAEELIRDVGSAA